MRALLIVVIATQAACLATHGVSVDDRTGWVDEADVRRAVELVFDESYWTEASPGLEIIFTDSLADVVQACDGLSAGCFIREPGIWSSIDQVYVLVGTSLGCLSRTSLAHELVHRWQYDHGWPGGHPVELFGDDDESGHGGLTGELECALTVDLCPWYVELSQRCQPATPSNKVRTEDNDEL